MKDMNKLQKIVCIIGCALGLFSLGAWFEIATGETMILRLNKSEVKQGEEMASAYVVDGKELSAIGKAGEDKGVDIVLVNVEAQDAEKVKADASYVAGSFLELAIKDPALAEKVLEVEYEIDGAEGKEMTREKVSEWKKAGSPPGRVRLPVQISGQPSELEYDAEGALKEVSK